MKKINILIAIAATLCFSSCDDYLSEMPDNRTVLNSPEKISEIFINFLSLKKLKTLPPSDPIIKQTA